MTPFGQTVFLWRRHRGLTQEALARRARLSRPNLSAVERGRREISLGTLRALALALDIRPGVLADGVPPAGAEQPPAPLSRGTLERIADAVAFGRPVAGADERQVSAALRTLLGHRMAAMRRRGGRPRASQRAALAAWMALKSRYTRAAIQGLADRVGERQRAHASSRD